MFRYGFGFESFYFVFLFVVIVYMFIIQAFSKFSKNSRFIFCFYLFVLFFLLSALRGDNVGADMKRYLPEFYIVSTITDLHFLLSVSSHEPLYLFIIKALSFISDNDRCFIVGTSLISLIGPFYMFYKLSINPACSILLYYCLGYYTNTFCNVRQSMAMSVVFVALVWLKEDKVRKFIMGVLIAIFIHYSAFVCMILYIFVKEPASLKRTMQITIGGLVGVGLLGVGIFRYLAMNYFAKYDPEVLMENSEGKGFGLFVFYLLVFIAYSIFYFKRKESIPYKDSLDYNFYLFLIIFSLIIQSGAPIFSSLVRMTYYFYVPFVTLCIPYIIKNINDQFLRSGFKLAVIILTLFFMHGVYRLNPAYINTNKQGTIPYVFIDKIIF